MLKEIYVYISFPLFLQLIHSLSMTIFLSDNVKKKIKIKKIPINNLAFKTTLILTKRV